MTNNTLTFQEVTETLRQYRKEFKKANISDTVIMALQDHYTIVETIQKKRNGRVYETEKKKITARQFMNELTWIGFFKARVYRNYSMIGNVIYKMVYVSPSGDESRAIHYSFIKDDPHWVSYVSDPTKAYKDAGFRERDCMDNCKNSYVEYSTGHELVHILHKDGEHGCIWDNITMRFVG